MKKNLAPRLRPLGGEGVRGSGGYNHSIRYKNHSVHVQTEDAGVRQAVIYTHVFVGGRVVGRRRASYADRLGTPDLATTVRKLVYDEHRAAFLALRDGEFDAALARLSPHDDEHTSGVVRRIESLSTTSFAAAPPAAGAHLPLSGAPSDTGGVSPFAAAPPAAGAPSPFSTAPPAAASSAPLAAAANSAPAALARQPGPSAAPPARQPGPSAAPTALACPRPAMPPAAPAVAAPRVTPTLPSLDLSSLGNLAHPPSPLPPRGAPRTIAPLTPSAPPPRVAIHLSPALRTLEGYRASGVVNLPTGEVLASDGSAGTGALVASLLAITSGHQHALAELGVEDTAGEFVLLGKSSCLLVRPLAARPGHFVYVLCDRTPTNVARARLSLGSAADDHR